MRIRNFLASIQEIAKCPNVVVKLGGVAMCLLGYDFQGRDVLSRLLVGARTAMLGPLAVVVGSMAAGVLLAAALWATARFASVYFAQMSVFRDETALQYLTIDPHSPPEFRANIVRNLDEFHAVFGKLEPLRALFRQRAKLEALLGYCEGTTCRRQRLLAYFGELSEHGLRGSAG